MIYIKSKSKDLKWYKYSFFTVILSFKCSLSGVSAQIKVSGLCYITENELSVGLLLDSLRLSCIMEILLISICRLVPFTCSNFIDSVDVGVGQLITLVLGPGSSCVSQLSTSLSFSLSEWVLPTSASSPSAANSKEPIKFSYS